MNERLLSLRNRIEMELLDLELERLGSLMSFLEDALSCTKRDLNFFCQLLDKAIL